MAKVNIYNIGKMAARSEAIEWQNNTAPLSYSELVDARIHFEKLGKRFGLIREFRENGII